MTPTSLTRPEYIHFEAGQHTFHLSIFQPYPDVFMSPFWLAWALKCCCWSSPPEEAATDEKRGKLYKPKSRFESQSRSILPLETPPQFLQVDKRHVSIAFGLNTLTKTKSLSFAVFDFSFIFFSSLPRRAMKKKRRRATWSFLKKSLNSTSRYFLLS